MADVRLESVRHTYLPYPGPNAPWALRGVDQLWQDGGAYALLGPSGCGKTTLLNIISGLVIPTEGRVLFGGRDVTTLPTEARNIAQVFQFPVLYDTMTVRENLAFPLRTRRIPTAQAKQRVLDIADMLELGPLLDRGAASLGAADKQKVALGRGLVRSDVAAILFDEPLTIIDPHAKFELRRKLKQIHYELKLTLIYVTHDQNEALTFADDVVVMSHGEIVQAGTPEELFDHPAHSFVGYFIGSPGMNFIDCRRADGGLVFDGGRVAVSERLLADVPASASLKIGIRPSAVKLRAPGAPETLAGKVVDVEELGEYRIVDVVMGETRIRARLRDEEPVPADDTGVMLPPANALVYADDRLVGALG